MQIRLAPQARTDLDAIWLYMAQESGSEAPANRLIAAIAERFQMLARFPYIGKSQEAELRAHIRTFPVGKHLIFYSIRPDELRILRVIHASRDAYAVFTQGLQG